MSTILLLDEDRIMLQSLAQLLRRDGYNVLQADSVERAMAVLETSTPQVLLGDLALPGVDPAALLRDLRKRFPQLVTVVLTGYGSIEGAVSAIRNGALDYLTKPVVDDEVRMVVEKAIRQQTLLHDNESLRQQLDERFGLGNVLGRDPRMQKIFEVVDAVADSRSTVLIVGESGTGKSLLARAIHGRSPRRDRPFVEVPCGALPESLLESELFGHVKGAFTGAHADKAGRFTAADGGTIFLDEINSASLLMQVKLLRVLQERSFEPVGSTTTKTVDTRSILATNADLDGLVKSGAFRQDLFYRINVVTIRLPPLRERSGDIPLLVDSFLNRFRKEMVREIVGLSDEARAALIRYPWPGNVRELENAIERSVVLCRRAKIELTDLPEAIQTFEPAPAALRIQPAVALEDLGPMPLVQALEAPEKRIIEAALLRNGWNRQATADELKIDRTTLWKKMQKYHITAASDAA
ncbi:MAG: sigma-54 dependent transcriptional regulator [Tepidisphaeraceae bacterium]